MDDTTTSRVPPWERNNFLPEGGTRISDALRALARALPDAVACDEEGRSLTFPQFAIRVDQIANTLFATSEQRSCVALVFGHGIEPFVTAIGALSAGLTVAPLDAREPADRLRDIIAISDASLIVTDVEHASIARAVSAGRPVLVLDDAMITSASTAELNVEISPETPGFLFFTSGSTGAPKGVLSAHHQVIPRYVSLGNEQGYGPGDRVAVTASFGFSLAHTYFLAAVLSGATACCFDLKRVGLGRLAEWVERRGITSVALVPSALRALPAAHAPMDTVRLVTLGGETVYGHDVRRARQHFGASTTFKNLLGSAEAGVIATYVVPLDQPDDQPVPCGILAPGLDVHIVDPDTDEPVTPGVTGRLVAVREHLSLGYWHDPELTAEHYFTAPDGRRGFATSDAVRMRDDGLLEHLGRLDARVKVRGAMVAPAGIEAVLLATGVVADTAVIASDDDDGHSRLVAYVVPAPGETVTAWQLRQTLSQKLPMAMLPSAIELLDAIPRTARDKVDRDALPPAAERPRPPFRQPQDYDQALASLFTAVLGVDPVGLDDDFFDLGGDSLAVVELVAAIDERFGIEVAATTILEAPTVVALARRLRGPRRPASSVVVQVHAADGIPWFCFAGAGDPATRAHAVARAVATRGCFGVQQRGLEARAWPDRTVARMARRGARAMQDVVPDGPYLVAGYSFGGLVAFECARLLAGHVGLLVLLDTIAPGTIAGRNKRRVSARVALGRARRRVALATAGIVPRRGLLQYQTFLQLSGRVATAYRPSGQFDGAVLVVRATEAWSPGTPPDLGWSRWVTGPITVVEVPTDHDRIMRAPAVATVGAELRAAFDQVS